MGTVSLGKIAFTWRGAFDASATYARQDVVGHHGDSFVCLADATTGVVPHANSPAWDLFAQGTQGVSNLPGEVIYFDGNQLVALPAGQSGQAGWRFSARSGRAQCGQRHCGCGWIPCSRLQR